MKLENFRNIYENPLPQLSCRQCYFPNLCENDEGKLLCCFTIGEAMEAVNCRQFISESADGGMTWSEPHEMFPEGDAILTDACKITNTGDGRIITFGYTFERKDKNVPLGNPETGGLLSDWVFYAFSEDGGRTFGERNFISEGYR